MKTVHWDRAVLLQELVSINTEVARIAKKENKKTGFCIGNTAQKIDRDYFFTPIRNTEKCVCGSVIIDCVRAGEMIVRELDGHVDYLLVDTEKKISPEFYGSEDAGNVERMVRSVVKKSKVLTFKGNDLTVDAIDAFLAQLITSDIRGLGGKKVAIIGVGNIGFKLALKLTERGSNVVLVRRNTKALNAIVKALNYVKPRSTIAKITGTSDMGAAMENSDIVVGLTPGTRDITASMVAKIKANAVLIDAGKGSFDQDALRYAQSKGMRVYRASITPSFEGQIAMLLRQEEILRCELGTREVDGVRIVSGSILGADDDVVVDNVFLPNRIYGIANGCGDFKRNLTRQDHLKLKRLKKILGI